MKRLTKILSALIALTLFTAFITLPAAAADDAVTAKYNEVAIVKNPYDESPLATVGVYNINNNNYFKLRDIALLLKYAGAAQPRTFNLSYNESTKAIVIIAYRSYVEAGGELATGTQGDVLATPTASKIYFVKYGYKDDIAGEEVEINPTGYTIKGNNYFKLRDIVSLINVYVGWDSVQNRIILDPKSDYVPEGSESLDTAAFGEYTPFAVNGITGGMSLADAEKILGTPYRTVDDPAQNKTQIDQQFRFYGDYSHFTMLNIRKGTVAGYYANYAPADDTNPKASYKGLDPERPGSRPPTALPSAGASGHGYSILYDVYGYRSRDGEIQPEDESDGRLYAVIAGLYSVVNSGGASEVIIVEMINAFRGTHNLPALNDHAGDNLKRYEVLRGQARKLAESVSLGETDATSWGSPSSFILIGHGNGVSSVGAWIGSTAGHRARLLADVEQIEAAYYSGVSVALAGTEAGAAFYDE